MTIQLEPYNWRTMQGRVRTMTFIKMLEANLKLPEESRLSDEENAARLMVAAGGEPGWIAKFMVEGLDIALERGLPKLDMAILGEVYDNIFPSIPQAQDEIGFGELLNDAILDAALLERQASNPFLCPFKLLESLWRNGETTERRRRAVDARREPGAKTSQAESSRATRIRGTGRAPLKAFGKG